MRRNRIENKKKSGKATQNPPKKKTKPTEPTEGVKDGNK